MRYEQPDPHPGGVLNVSQFVHETNTNNPPGASRNLAGEAPPGGFMVSDYGAEKIVGAPLNVADAANYVMSNHASLSVPDKYAGSWQSGDSPVFLDVSANVGDKKQALKEGQKQAQIAVWDVKRGTSLPSFIETAPSLKGTLWDGAGTSVRRKAHAALAASHNLHMVTSARQARGDTRTPTEIAQELHG